MHLLLYTYWVSVSLSCVWLHGMRLFELRSHWRRLSIGTPVCADETSILPRVHLIPLPLGMLGLNMKLIESITALLYQDCKAVRRYHHGKWRRVLKSDCLSTDSVSLQTTCPHSVFSASAGLSLWRFREIARLFQNQWRTCPYEALLVTKFVWQPESMIRQVLLLIRSY